MTFVKLLEPFAISMRTFPVLFAINVILFSSRTAPTPYFSLLLISLNKSFIVVFESISSSLPFIEKVPVEIVKPIFSARLDVWSCIFIDLTPFESMYNCPFSIPAPYPSDFSASMMSPSVLVLFTEMVVFPIFRIPLFTPSSVIVIDSVRSFLVVETRVPL